MTPEQIFEVIEKLCGETEPYADAAIDSERFLNIKTFIDVFNQMLYTIEDIAIKYKDSPYNSAKNIGKLCENQIISIKN